MGNDGAETDWYSSTKYTTPLGRFELWLVLGIFKSHIRFLKPLFLYPCTLKVLPLAVFRSFSSFSGLARLRTSKSGVVFGMLDKANTYLAGSLPSVFAFLSGCKP